MYCVANCILSFLSSYLWLQRTVWISKHMELIERQGIRFSSTAWLQDSVKVSSGSLKRFQHLKIDSTLEILGPSLTTLDKARFGNRKMTVMQLVLERQFISIAFSCFSYVSYFSCNSSETHPLPRCLLNVHLSDVWGCRWLFFIHVNVFTNYGSERYARLHKHSDSEQGLMRALEAEEIHLSGCIKSNNSDVKHENRHRTKSRSGRRIFRRRTESCSHAVLLKQIPCRSINSMCLKIHTVRWSQR